MERAQTDSLDWELVVPPDLVAAGFRLILSRRVCDTQFLTRIGCCCAESELQEVEEVACELLGGREVNGFDFAGGPAHGVLVDEAEVDDLRS